MRYGKTTIQDAKLILRQRGISINKKEDEFRVNFLGADEDTAYYTDDIEDALRTGLAMAVSRDLELGRIGVQPRPRIVN